MDEALKYHTQSFEIYKKNGNLQGQADALANIGFCYVSQRKRREAIDLLNQARSIYLKIGAKGFDLQAVEEVILKLRRGL